LNFRIAEIYLKFHRENIDRMGPDLAKIVVIVTLGLGSLMSGLLPAALSQYHQRRNSILQTILLCFGAGILLATSLVHMLPEVSNRH